jgi:GNAT superfamily N-acetyltransferase
MTAGSRFVPVVDDHGESPYCPEPRARRASRAGGGEQAAGTQGALRDELFDCVPLDVLMPELDGYQRGEAIVAYGQAMREEPTVVESCGVVHPGHRGRGIGSWLLDRIQQRASGLLAGVPSPRFRHAVNAGDRPAAAMLQARALRPVRHFWHMQIELAAGFEAGPTPAGIEISGIDPRVHLPAVHAVIEEAFADHWATIRSRSSGGRCSRPGARATTQRCGCWPPKQGSRWAPSPRTSPATAAGWTSSASWHRPRARNRAGSPRSLLRDVRASRVPAGVAERRCGEPDRGDEAVRACGDARGEPVGPVGAVVGRPALA